MEIEADECSVLFINEYLRYDKQAPGPKLEGLQLCGIASSIISLALSTSIESKSTLRNGKTHPAISQRYRLILFKIQVLSGKDMAKEVVETVNWFCEESNYYFWEEKWWTIHEGFFEELEKRMPEILANSRTV